MDFIELYAGIGGFRYGLEKANDNRQEASKKFPKSGQTISGYCTNDSRQFLQRATYNCVWANELDRYASQIYREHWNDGTLCEGDIRTIDVDAIPEHGLICAGFPCQSFSIAGKRGGFADIRGTLFYEICRIARAKGTSYLWLENVKGLLSAPYTETIQEWSDTDFNGDGKPTVAALKTHRAIPGTKGWVFLTILYTLWELGYDCQWEVLNSKNFGVPQNRERVFIIGHLRGKPRLQIFPIGQICERFDEGEYDLPNVRTLQGGGHSGGHHSGMTLIRTRSDQEYREEGIPPPIRQSDKAGVRIIQIGHRTSGKPHFYENKIPSMTQDYGTGGQNVPLVAQALQSDGQLRQGTSWNTDKPQSAGNIRRLTPIECERLQGFPDNWTSSVSDTQRYKCLGNAVTTNVITVIGERFLGALTKD